MSIFNSFKFLPTKTKNLLILGITLALFVALPLFVWSIVNMTFDVREKAEVRLCLPRPACLDLKPPCLLPVPIEGWCPTPTPVAGCGLNCIRNSDCSPNLICVKPNNVIVGKCRNPSCITSRDCLCQTKATPTITPTAIATMTPTSTATATATATMTATATATLRPTSTATATSSPTILPLGGGSPNSCGGTCGSNYNCQANFFCYEGRCRNPLCKTEADCQCNSSTTKPTAATGISKSTPQASPTPSQSPVTIFTYPPASDIPSFATELPIIDDKKNTRLENQFWNKYAFYIFSGFVIIMGAIIYFSRPKKKVNNFPHISSPTNI